MAERKVDIVVGSPTASASGKIVQLADMTREQRKARRAEVLERGNVGDRMHVELPAGMYGQWVHNSKEEIYRLESLGFKVDTEHASKRALHSEGDGKSIVGDVIFMTCDPETKQDIDEFRTKQFEAIHGKPGVRRSAAEEREFAQSMATEQRIPAIMASETTAVSGAEIASSLMAK